MNIRALEKKYPKGDTQVFNGLPLLNANVAGIDIGSQTHYVAVPEGRSNPSVKTFGCYTADIQEMAKWLKECGVTSIAMESTGVYWVTSYSILEAAGFEVKLVDSHHTKNVPGHKTDVMDAIWIQKLHSYGLLRGCFIPPAEVKGIRIYWRRRDHIVKDKSVQILRIQKALEMMNIHLHKAISDITGMSGLRIIRKMVSGERNPAVLALLADKGIKASQETLIKALEGNYSDELMFDLTQALEHYDFLDRQLVACDLEMQKSLTAISDRPTEATDLPSSESTGKLSRGQSKPYRRKNEPYFNMVNELKRITGVDLTKIPGISSITAMTIYSELGSDLSCFPTEKQFCAWAALSPNNRITGGKVRSKRTRPRKNRLATALCVAAQSLHRSNCATGAFLRRMKGRLGAPKAITATAHRLARQVYFMLTRGEAFVDEGAANYEKKFQERQLSALKKRAIQLGFTLTDTCTGEVCT